MAWRAMTRPAGRRAARAITLVLAAAPAFAQAPAPGPTSPLAQASPQVQLRGVEHELKGSEQSQEHLQANLETIRADRARLVAALLETTAKTRADEQRVSDVEKQLETAQGSENAIRRTLSKHREVIGEVLAALQRMGRKPPPAVLVDPEDMLKAIRTSMLLGSILPDMRSKIHALASDLHDLARVRISVAREKTSLAAEVAALGSERKRLNLLIAARQASQDQAEHALAAEVARSHELASQASDLKDLISKMEKQIGPARRAAEAARRADRQNSQQKPQNEQLAALPPQSPARLAPAVPFTQTRGLLPFPVVGTPLKSYGAPDGFGGKEKGMSIATPPGAIVISPADGWVAYAGPYRSYGQLLILNAGGGYYLVLAGMDRTNVEVGQFVLAGEPIGSMGDGSQKTAAAIAIGAAQPILYVEFRKDGATIDPGPWWATPELEKARG